ncbi:MAG: LapA family protein [Alphaproteobacteria bacterium]
MAFLKTLIGIPILLIILVFAFMNNDLATFSLWPLNFEIEVSLSVMIVLLVLIGFLLGNFFLWLSYAPLRKELRNHKKQNKKLSKEQNKLVKEMEGLHSDLHEFKQEDTKSKPSFFKRIFKKKSEKDELVK